MTCHSTLVVDSNLPATTATILFLRIASLQVFKLLSKVSAIVFGFAACGAASLTELLEESVHQQASHPEHRQDGEPRKVQAAQSEADLDTGVMECYVFQHSEGAESHVQLRFAGPASRSVPLVP